MYGQEPAGIEGASSPSVLEFFDADFYLAQCPQLRESSIQPLDDYLERGWREELDPSPSFSTAFYLLMHGDVAASGMNPLIHYVNYGFKEGRQIHPMRIDGRTKLSERPSILDFFDAKFYLAQCPELRKTSTHPIFDYLKRGWRKGLDPSPSFSTAFYLQIYPDVAATGVNPLVHYVTQGFRERRQIHPERAARSNGEQSYRIPGLESRSAFQRSVTPATPSRFSAAFRDGKRPLLRWIKANGLDDVVTRSAIAQANEVFGDTVDYCLCTAGIAAPRVREILAWATQPVEWWPLDPSDNAELASILERAGCSPQHYGYWWKWFPERVRPNAPEWILDGDMVNTAKPRWFSAWAAGIDRLRVSQDDEWPMEQLYGEYLGLVDRNKRLYSGLVSLAPGQRYMPGFLQTLKDQMLAPGHDGRVNVSEQGVVAATFSRLDAEPIPLNEFPFARALEDELNFGRSGPGHFTWGYHFGYAFRQDNHHFARLIQEEVIFWRNDVPRTADRHAWMRNAGQWGQAGWSMNPVCVERILKLARQCAGKPVLEIGTSRGYLAASMADLGCIVTTVDREDRGAVKNLQGLTATAVITDGAEFLRNSNMEYALITADLHGNDVAAWRELWPLLIRRVAAGGTAVLYNSHLWQIPEWRSETGIKWLMQEMLADFSVEIFPDPLPGMIVVKK